MNGFGLVAHLSIDEIVGMRFRGDKCIGVCVEPNFPHAFLCNLAHEQYIVTADDVSDVVKTVDFIKGFSAIGHVASRTGEREANARAARCES